MSVVLTEEFIRIALGDRDRPIQKELADELEPGLRLRLAAREARWSVLTKTVGEDRVRIPLGGWPAVSLDEARRFARSIKTTYEQRGEDPATFSVAQLLDRYRARRLSQLRKGKVMGRALEAALAPVKYREAARLTRREIAELIDDIADRAPIHANRVLAYMKAFFNWSVGRGYLEATPAAAIAKPSREVTRERTPSLKEIVEIWAAGGTLGYPFGPIVKLLILTAARREEVGALRVSELELPKGSDEGVWVLPASRSKNGRAIRTPLSPLARKVLEDALKLRPKGSDLVFTTTGQRPVSGWSRAKRRLDAAIAAARKRSRVIAPMDPWRFHDLRRSFATHACDVLKVDPAVADRCLNHVGASTTSTVARVYARSEMFEQRREALSGWAALIDEALAQRAPSKAQNARGAERSGR